MKELPSILARRIAELTEPGFFALIGPKGDFSSAAGHPSPFFWAMTLRALQVAPDPALAPTQERLSERLRAERSRVGAWNYWARHSVNRELRPLPDDLDTTSCALAALAETSQGVPEAWIAEYASLLTLRETVPGGPYRTWIVPSDAEASWQDVDPVVNANIGLVLHAYEAVPEPLSRFLGEAILDPKRRSPYYPDRSAFLYSLARWYRGEARNALVRECHGALQHALAGGGLQELAFALASCAALEESEPTLLQAGVTALAERLKEPKVVPQALCIDAVHGGIADHAGSPAFTLALAREALCRSLDRLVTPPSGLAPTGASKNRTMTAVMRAARDSSAKLPPSLRESAADAIDETVRNRGEDLVGLPFALAGAATGAGTFDESHADIGAANVLGWVAYTLYDDVMDGDRGSEALWTANALMRLSFEGFLASFPGDQAWGAKCRDTFARMDGANLEEWRSWQLRPAESRWRLPERLPSSDLESLAGRSAGMILAPLALLMRIGGNAAKPAIPERAERFLLHLIAARQLCDDAHDWENDLRKGRLNHASVRLFPAAQAATLLDISSDTPELRRRFWDSAVGDVRKDVRIHCEAARAHAAHFKDREWADRLLAPLEASMEKAVKERDSARAFLEAYRKAPILPAETSL